MLDRIYFSQLKERIQLRKTVNILNCNKFETTEICDDAMRIVNEAAFEVTNGCFDVTLVTIWKKFFKKK